MSIKASPTMSKPACPNMTNEAELEAVREMPTSISQNGNQLTGKQYYWFCAETSIGQIFLGLSAQNEADVLTNKMTDSILLMQKAETAIQLFEDWLDLAFKLVPVSDVREYPPLQIEFTAKENNPVRGILALPAAVLPLIRQPPEEMWQSYSIQWKSLPLDLTLSRMSFPQSLAKKIEPGGMYLITESFQPDWYCEAIVRNVEDIRFRARLNNSNALEILRQIDNNDEIPAADIPVIQGQELRNIEVCLAKPVYIPADCLVQWAENKNINLEDSLFSSNIYLLSDGLKIAYGKVMPVSHGYAVLIENLLGS